MILADFLNRYNKTKYRHIYSQLNFNTHSVDLKTIGGYLNEECLVAYIDNTFMGIFLIKGKNKYFGFYCIRNDFPVHNCFTYDLKRINNLSYLNKLFEEEKPTIINSKQFEEFKKTLILESISDYD